jgi:malate dehydrogenase (oxaloacetate-decarboxylating)(NADP+)
MFNSKGLLTKDNPKLSELQLKYAKDIPSMNLEEAALGSRCFRFVNGDIMSAQMLLGMSDNPIVLQWQIQIQKF